MTTVPENILLVFRGEPHLAPGVLEVDFVGVLGVGVGEEEVVPLQLDLIKSKLFPLVKDPFCKKAKKNSNMQFCIVRRCILSTLVWFDMSD